jgi:hypothetical protein
MNIQPLLAYYPDADVPTLRIAVQLQEDVAVIRRLFGKLASGEIQEAELGAVIQCNLEGIRALILCSARRRPSRALAIEYQTSSGPVLRWSDTTCYWLEWAEKVDPVLESDSACHQYFWPGGRDEIVVELCYREYGSGGSV